jgi:hypothetical protein
VAAALHMVHHLQRGPRQAAAPPSALPEVASELFRKLVGAIGLSRLLCRKEVVLEPGEEIISPADLVFYDNAGLYEHRLSQVSRGAGRM